MILNMLGVLSKVCAILSVLLLIHVLGMQVDIEVPARVYGCARLCR